MSEQQLFALITKTSNITQQERQLQQQLLHQPLQNILPLIFKILPQLYQEVQKVIQQNQANNQLFQQLLLVLIQLKNCISGRTEEFQLKKQNEWNQIPLEFKMNTHMFLINMLHSLPLKLEKITIIVCEIISIIASYDLPQRNWDELIDQLLVTNISSNAQNNCILTLALITEKLKEADLTPWLPKILPKFVEDVQNEIFTKNKLLGLKNLISHRSFSFNRMYDIYGVLTDSSARIDQKEICEIYLDSLVVAIIKCYEPFSKIADEKFTAFLVNIMERYINEVEMLKKVLDVFCELGKMENFEMDKKQSKNILTRNYQELFGKFVTIMGRNINQMFEDDDDEGENQNNVVVVVLEIFVLMTMQLPNEFVPFILNQLNGMLKGEPILQYIATMIFGRLIEGKADVNVIKQFFMEMSMTYGKTPEIIIKIAASDVIVKMLEQHPEIFIPDQINYLIGTTFQTFTTSKDDKFAIAGCRLLGAFYDNINKIQEQKVILNNHSQTTIQLMQMLISQRNETCKRNALKALIPLSNWLASNNSSDKIIIIYGFMLTCINQFAKNAKLVSNCLEVIAECLSSNGHMIMKNPQQYNLDTLMNGLYNYLTNPDAYDSALKAIVSVSEVMGEHFAKYLEAVLQHLINNFNDLSQKEMIEQTCETIGSIAKGVRSIFTKYSQPIIGKLMQMIQMNEIDRTTKIFIINCIGGIAEGIGFEQFTPYRNGVIEQIMKMTQYYLQSQLDLDNEDNAEFFQDLIYSVFDFFASIVKNGNPSQFNFFNQPMQLILQIHQMMCPIPGKVYGEVVYSGICQFLLSITSVAVKNQQQQLIQNIFNQQIMEIINGADSIVGDVDNYEDLRDPVDDLFDLLRKIGFIQ